VAREAAVAPLECCSAQGLQGGYGDGVGWLGRTPISGEGATVHPLGKASMAPSRSRRSAPTVARKYSASEWRGRRFFTGGV